MLNESVWRKCWTINALYTIHGKCYFLQPVLLYMTVLQMECLLKLSLQLVPPVDIMSHTLSVVTRVVYMYCFLLQSCFRFCNTRGGF